MHGIDTAPFRIAPDIRVNLSSIDTDQDGGLKKDDAKKKTKQLLDRLQDLQELMYAEGKHALLIVFQAMDAAGKDSTIRHVLGPVNPQGCRVTSFKVPTELERQHDFLWRVHQHVPPTGMIGVFNRSHYEDVLVVRVKNLKPKKRWQQHYEEINAFERLISRANVHILKFYLHVSKSYQKERFQRRLDRPDKLWKFRVGDLEDRALWDDYRAAYEDAMSKCSPAHAPWYVVPSETRWYRNLIVASTLVQTLEGLKMEHPPIDFDPQAITIPD